MTTRFARFLAPFVVLLWAPGPGLAQSNPPDTEHGTHLGILVGASTMPSRAGAVVSGTAGWQLNRWAAIEARGSWFADSEGLDSFGADLGGLFNIRPAREVTPYVGAAFGLYRASFATPSEATSNFYRRRMQAGFRDDRRVTFTDPALRLTAGVDVLAGRNFVIRPEASVLFVRRGGHGDTLGIFGMTFAYRFEDHPVTPLRQ